MSLSQRIHDEIVAAFADAEVEVMSQDEVHFYVTVFYPGFAGKPLLQQHKMVYDALSEDLKTTVHALSLHTRTS
jgi:stress-induced morphogen